MRLPRDPLEPKPPGYRMVVFRRFGAGCLVDKMAPVAPNLVDAGFTVEAPNSLWVGDITYVPTDEG